MGEHLAGFECPDCLTETIVVVRDESAVVGPAVFGCTRCERTFAQDEVER